MVNSKGKLHSLGKLREEGPPKRVRIVWTAGGVEPGDKGMIVTIIPLPAAPNPGVGPLTNRRAVSICTNLTRGGAKNPYLLEYR